MGAFVWEARVSLLVGAERCEAADGVLLSGRAAGSRGGGGGGGGIDDAVDACCVGATGTWNEVEVVDAAGGGFAELGNGTAIATGAIEAPHGSAMAGRGGGSIFETACDCARRC